MLDAARRSQWERDGFVNAGALFGAQELGSIAVEYDRLVRFDAQVLGDERDGVFAYRAMLNFRSPVLRKFVLHPALLEIAVELLGPDVRFWWDQGINKAPGSGSTIPWHQDNGYVKGRMPAYLTCWIALDDSSLAVSVGRPPGRGARTSGAPPPGARGRRPRGGRRSAGRA